MKSVFVVLAVLAALAATQNMDDLPPCAKPCIEPILKNGLLGCQGTDLKCICSKQETIQVIGGCLQKQGCSQADMSATLKHAHNLCLLASVTIPTTMPTTMPTTTPSGINKGTATHTGTGTVTTTSAYKSGGSPNSTSTHAPTSTSTGAAATGYIINGLGVAGAAAAFFFL